MQLGQSCRNVLQRAMRVLQRELIMQRNYPTREAQLHSNVTNESRFSTRENAKAFLPPGKVKYKSEKKVPFSFPPFQTLFSSQENAKTPYWGQHFIDAPRLVLPIGLP